MTTRDNEQMIERARKRLRKRAKRGLRDYPVATVALSVNLQQWEEFTGRRVLPVSGNKRPSPRRPLELIQCPRRPDDEIGGGGG